MDCELGWEEGSDLIALQGNLPSSISSRSHISKEGQDFLLRPWICTWLLCFQVPRKMKHLISSHETKKKKILESKVLPECLIWNENFHSIVLQY